jgi:hypothetical protein
LLRRILEAITRILATVIGRETEKNYVVRPWTDEENADFLEFCDRIDEIPSDPELALAMEDGEVDFFNNDPFYNVKCYRC